MYYHYVSQVDGFDILPGYENPSDVFYDALRLDLVLKRNHHIIVIELICCLETKLVHSRNFKTEKYNIKRYSTVTVNKIEKNFLKVSSLGFIAKTFKPLEKFLLKSNVNCNRLKQKMFETAVRGSYYIYTGKTKEWNNPQLIKFI